MNQGKRVMEQTGDLCYRHNSNGVDLNRNADWEWGGAGSSGKKGDEEYRGESVWSESEARWFRDLVLSNGYLAYFSLHSGEQQLMSPFVDTKSRTDAKRRRRPGGERGEEAMLSYMKEKSKGWIRSSGQAFKIFQYVSPCLSPFLLLDFRNIPRTFLTSPQPNPPII